VYKGGENAISSQGRNILKQLRTDFTDEISRGMPKEFINVGGNQTTVGAVWNKMNGRYRDFRQVYDDFALVEGKLDSRRAANTISRMIGDKGDFLTQDFQAVSKLAGDATGASLNKLQVLESAKNLTALYSQPRAGTGQVVSSMVTGGITSPRNIPSHLTIKKITEPTAKALGYLGKGVDFITRQDPRTAMGILADPNLFRTVFNAANLQEEQALSNQLLQGTGLE
jgi:hypothetical protein